MRISLVAMKTWGELGNYLAAHKLKLLLEIELPMVSVEVISGEALFPTLAKAGCVIRDIASARISSTEKRMRYCSLMSELQGTLFAPSHLKSELAVCTRYLSVTSPHLVVGMKGVVSRLLCEAIKRSHLCPAPRFVNFITNPGLLDISLHYCPEAEITTFPLSEQIWDDAKLPSGLQHRVTRVSPLLRRYDGEADKPEEIIWAEASRRTILILSNHGGLALVEAARIALEHPSRPNVGLVILRDPEALVQGELLATAAVTGRFFISNGMDHAKYFGIARRAAAIEGSFLLSKTGPNTMLEAVSLGLPALLHSSWLPMEAWVKPFVHQNGIGDVLELDEIPETVRQWLDGKSAIKQYGAAVRNLKTILFPKTSQNAVAKLFQGILWNK